MRFFNLKTGSRLTGLFLIAWGYRLLYDNGNILAGKTIIIEATP